MRLRPRKELDIFGHFDTLHDCDGRTEGQTLAYVQYCAYVLCRAVKTYSAHITRMV